MNPSCRLEWAFARIPLLAGSSPAEFRVTPIRGYTNLNFRLVDDSRDWILRIPRTETNAHIDRAAEAHNQRIACELDLAPQTLWRNADGLSVTPTIRAGRELCAADLTNPVISGKVVSGLQRLHRSGRRFRGAIDLAELLNRYYALLPAAHRQRLGPGFHQAQATISKLPRDLALVPSHNDLVLENLLLDGERLWLIDWEYSAMASPYWDLATLCNEAGLDQPQGLQLLQSYCAAGPAMEESTLCRYRQLLQLLSECWMAAFAD